MTAPGSTGRREAPIVAATLRAWLRAKPGLHTAEIDNLARPAGAGLSNETWLFDCVTGNARDPLVVQIGPAGRGLFRDYDLAAMARVQTQIARVSTVPIAPVRWYEEDSSLLGAPFYVMQRVRGQVPGDNPPYHVRGWFRDAPPAVQRAAWESGIRALAALHALDPAQDGFAFLCAAPWGMPFAADAGLARIAQWRDLLAWGARRAVPSIEHAFDTLEHTRPAQRPLRVAWGDAKISNCVIEDGAVRALLDWELCGLSDPQEDLAFWLLLDWAQWTIPGVPRLAALPSPRETVACYESASGARVEDVLWWFKFGLVRLAVIYHRFIERRIELGRLTEDVDAEALNPMCARLPEVLAIEDLPA